MIAASESSQPQAPGVVIHAEGPVEVWARGPLHGPALLTATGLLHPGPPVEIDGARLLVVRFRPTLHTPPTGDLVLRLLPRMLQRVARQHGALHIAATGLSGTLLAAALAQVESKLPSGVVVLGGAPADLRRGPRSARWTRLLGEHHAAIAPWSAILAGPSTFAQVAPQLPLSAWRSSPSPTVAANLITELSQGGAVLPFELGRRPITLALAADDTTLPTPTCAALAHRWSGPAETVVLDGHVGQLSSSQSFRRLVTERLLRWSRSRP